MEIAICPFDKLERLSAVCAQFVLECSWESNRSHDANVRKNKLSSSTSNDSQTILLFLLVASAVCSWLEIKLWNSKFLCFFFSVVFLLELCCCDSFLYEPNSCYGFFLFKVVCCYYCCYCCCDARVFNSPELCCVCVCVCVYLKFMASWRLFSICGSECVLCARVSVCDSVNE